MCLSAICIFGEISIQVLCPFFLKISILKKFISFWLCWIFIAAWAFAVHRLFVAVAVAVAAFPVGFSSCSTWGQWLASPGLQSASSIVGLHGSVAPGRVGPPRAGGSNPRLVRW